MRDFPSSAIETRNLALNLVKFLKENIENTNGRLEWTYRNLDLLQKFFGKESLGLHCRPDDSDGEFLWDFVAY